MGPLIPIFGAVLAQLLPQVGVLFGGKQDAKNAQVVQTVLDTIVKTATGDPNATPTVATVGAAVEAMQASKDTQKKVQEAVVTQPEVMGALQLIEVGGGAAGAREADIKARADDRPFWQTSAVFWVSVLLLPLVYWLVGSLIVGGVAVPDTWPAWVQAPFKLFGTAWNGESRSGGFNLVIGLVLGGICGVYFGVSVTQAKQGQAAQPPREA